jgi:hypothetical protein
VPLYQAMYSTTARQAPVRVGHARVSASSPLREAKKLSATALSQHWPLRPTDKVTWQSPARAANAAEVYWQPRSELSRIRLNSDYAEDGVKPRNYGLAWSAVAG